MTQKIRIFFLALGTVCTLWIVIFLLNMVILGLAVIFKLNYHIGTDTFTQVGWSFIHLPIWAMIPVTLSAAYTVTVIIYNRVAIKKWLNEL